MRDRLSFGEKNRISSYQQLSVGWYQRNPVSAWLRSDRYNWRYVTITLYLMRSQPINITYEIDLQPGEMLHLPPELTARIGAGRWLITIQPVSSPQYQPTRSHDAFLNSYAPEDEGLYDDYTR